MDRTLYGVLGVEPDADEDAIVSAYRERVKCAHPDVNDAPDAEAEFKRLQTARAVLTDADERARYDRLGHETYVERVLDGERWNGQTGTQTAASRRAAETASGASAASTTAQTTTQGGGTDGYATAADYYRAGERVGVERTRGVGSTLDAVIEFGPWLVAHVLLLGSAGTVAAMLLAGGRGPPPLTTVIVAATMVGITVCVSLLHVTSSLYR